MKLLRFLIVMVSLLLLWQIAVYLLKLPTYILPTPLAIIQTAVEQFPLIWQQTLPTLLETVLGFLFGALSGMFAALLLASFKPLRLWLLPLLVVSQAIPTFAIAPLLVLWFGYGEASKIITAMLMIFFPVASAFFDGLQHTNAQWLALAKTMNASRGAILWKIKIPAALPALASGLRIAAAIAPVGAIVGEWVGASHGLGFLMLNANGRMEVSLMFAALMMIVGLTLILYYSVDKILWWLIPWQAKSEER